MKRLPFKRDAMQSLLKRITDKAKAKGYGFRVDAYDMWNYGCNDYITDYHTDFEKLKLTLQSFESETIHFAKLKDREPLEKQLANKGFESIEELLPEDDEIAYDILSGDYAIRWINYGGNTGTDCLNDGSSYLWEDLGISKIAEDYDNELCEFQRF